MSTRATVSAEAPDVVSQRLEVLSVELLLDDVMARIPRGTINLAADDSREWFRGWARNLIERVLFEMRWAVVKGAERGIDQAIALAKDPDYYKTRSRRRRREGDRQRIEQQRQRAESEKWRAEEAERRRKAEEDTRALIATGKLVPITGRWQLRDAATGKPVTGRAEPPVPTEPAS